MARLPPTRLYKYRTFSESTLSVLVEDVVYFADPSTFNDPLDVSPNVRPDLSVPELEAMLTALVNRRVTAELSDAASTLRYRGPRTAEHIEKLARRAADQVISTIRYNATDPDYAVDSPEQLLLAQAIEDELRRDYGKGVLSLAERSNCPLMWSHYGGQHHGVCLGYSLPTGMTQQVGRVRYGGSRLVLASSIQAMLRGDEGARETVDASVLFTKARRWAYEREWRLIGKQGLQDSPLELEEVIFGMRCPTAVIYAITRSLATRGREVNFFVIREQQGNFELRKLRLDLNSLNAELPRRCREYDGLFDDVSDELEP